LFKIKPPARRAYAPEGHVKKITIPVRSAGPAPVPSPGATGQAGQAGICLIFRGLFFEHNAKIGPRLNIKYEFNPDGINRKINSIGQAGQAKRPFIDGH